MQSWDNWDKSEDSRVKVTAISRLQTSRGGKNRCECSFLIALLSEVGCYNSVLSVANERPDKKIPICSVL